MANMAARFFNWNAPKGYDHSFHYAPTGDAETVQRSGDYELVITGEEGRVMMLVRESNGSYIVATNPLFHGAYRRLRQGEKNLPVVEPTYVGEWTYKFSWTSPVSGATYNGRSPNYMYNHGVDARLAYRRTCSLCTVTIPDDARPEKFEDEIGVERHYPVVCDECAAHVLIPAEKPEKRRERALAQLAKMAEKLQVYVNRSGFSRRTGDWEACLLAKTVGKVADIVTAWGPSAVRDFTGLVSDGDLVAAFAKAGLAIEAILARHDEGGKEEVHRNRKVYCVCHAPADQPYSGNWR